MKGILILLICAALLLCSGCVQRESQGTGEGAVANQTAVVNETANLHETAQVNETANLPETVEVSETAKANESSLAIKISPLEDPSRDAEKVEAMPSNVAEASAKLSSFVVTINTPRPGDLLTGDDDVNFSASVTGGTAPYSYVWTSNINGVLSQDQTFALKPSDLQKGEHIIVLRVADASGQTAQSSVIVNDL